MSSQDTQHYSKIFPNMSLTQIAQIPDLRRRALALSYTAALNPDDPMVVALVKSVDVSEAGSWGANVVARVAALKSKTQSSRARKRRSVSPSDTRPNLFIDFENEVSSFEIAQSCEMVSSASPCGSLSFTPEDK